MPGFFKSLGNFFTGTPEKRRYVSNLSPEQQQLSGQLVNAGMGPGAGGAFGTSADYYRNLMSDDSADYNAFAAPTLRQYNEDIVPGLSEQFAGMGAGGLSSSGFRNAQMQGATDLAERLGALRAQLRQSGAQGLQNIGQLGLGNFGGIQTTQQGTPGILQGGLGALGTALGSPSLGTLGSQFGDMAGNWMKNSWGGNKVGINQDPYKGANIQASPQSR
jgi:hypothetical protein